MLTRYILPLAGVLAFVAVFIGEPVGLVLWYVAVGLVVLRVVIWWWYRPTRGETG